MTRSDNPPPQTKLTFGSRKSKLALWQTHTVCQALCAAEPSLDCRVEEMSTAGDRNLDQPLPQIGGKGLFTDELNKALREKRIDIAVHSLKDLPTVDDPGIKTVPVLQREDPRDVLIARDGLKLRELPSGAIVGTSSPRRKAQLLAIRADLNVQSIRGNVPTRVAKVLEPDAHPNFQYDAVVMAAAGIIRLGLQDTITEYFSLEDFLPAPGQGCVGATCRNNDQPTINQLKSIADPASSASVAAERQLLRALGGGCSAPIAAYGRTENGQLVLSGRVSTLDGKTVVTKTATGNDPIKLANDVAEQMLSSGADAILKDVFPLSGKRIVITRAANQNHELAGLLHARGAEVISMPLIKFNPVVDVEQAKKKLPELEACDRIVFTSANGVRFFNSLFSPEQSLAWREKMFFVGPKTAATMQETWKGSSPFPIQTEFGKTFSARDYAESLNISVGEKVIAPTAVVHMKEVVGILDTKGAEVFIWPIYETVNEKIQPTALAELTSGFDSILFVSPSSVRSFCEQVGDYHQVLENVTIGCIGSTTRKRAEEMGIQVQITPERFTTDDLVDALADYYRECGDQIS